jgi:hypothetical protein
MMLTRHDADATGTIASRQAHNKWLRDKLAILPRNLGRR